MRRTILTSSALLLLTLAAYWQVKDHDFVPYDDDKYITDNVYVQQGLTAESIQWAFTSGYASNWHPLTWLSHMLDYERFGLNPTGHHLNNLFFHLLNTLLLFLLLNRMTGRFWQSAFVAALFALHPLHVESVAWAAERKDLLSALFWILTMWAYVAYVRKPSRLQYLVVLIVFALGLMAKPMLVTLPFVLLLLDYWPLDRVRDVLQEKTKVGQLIKEKIPLLVLAAASSVITYFVQQAGGGMSMAESTAMSVRVANAVDSYFGYILKMFWPANLAVFYPHLGEMLSAWRIIGVAVALLAVTVLVFKLSNRYRYLTVGWLWYLGTLVPVIGIVQVGAQAMADRYTYIPLIGLFFMTVWGMVDLTAHWRTRKLALGGVGTAVVGVLAILTWQQVGYWNNGEQLFRHALDVTENNWLAHNNLATVLEKQGKLPEAEDHLLRTLEIHANLPLARYNLGNVYWKQGKRAEAIAQYQQALQLNSRLANVHLNWGLVLMDLDSVEEAISHYRAALEIDPEFSNAHYNVAIALERQGKYAEAVAHFREVLRYDPHDQDVLKALERLSPKQKDQQ